MASNWVDWMDEDEACSNCGEVFFHQSKTLGICLECASELLARSFQDNESFETVL